MDRNNFEVALNSGIWICGCSLFHKRELWASKSAGAHSIKSLKISGCKRWCHKDLRVRAPAAPVLTQSLTYSVHLLSVEPLQSRRREHTITVKQDFYKGLIVVIACWMVGVSCWSPFECVIKLKSWEFFFDMVSFLRIFLFREDNL